MPVPETRGWYEADVYGLRYGTYRDWMGSTFECSVVRKRDGSQR